MNLIIWIISGALIGWVFSAATHAKFRPRLVGNVLAGIAGSLCAEFLLSSWLGVTTAIASSFSFLSLMVALVGAVILPGTLHIVHRSTVR